MPGMPESIQIPDSEGGTAADSNADINCMSKTEASIQRLHSNSYYYAWEQASKRQQEPQAPTLQVPVPPRIPTAASTPIATEVRRPASELVSREPGEDWVDPPPPGGWMLATPAPSYSSDQLFSWSNWVSPPRGWPYTFTSIPQLKHYVGSELAGKRVRLTEPPHPMEFQRMRELQAHLSEKDSRCNALAVRRHLGWEVIGGFALLELAQGCARRDPVDKPIYHGERHWWNTTPKGLWMDFTLRKHYKKLVLVESAKTIVPEAQTADAAAMKKPAERADEVCVDFECNGVSLPAIRITGKGLDGDDGSPISFLEACLQAVERPYRAARSARPLDKHALRSITVDGVEVLTATTAHPRELLRVDARQPSRRPQVVMTFYPEGSSESVVLKWAMLHVPRLREGTTLCLSRMSDTSEPIGKAGLHTLVCIALEVAPLSVKNLHLDGNSMDDEALELLMPLMQASMPNLERLILRGNAISDAGIALLLPCISNRALSELDLSQNHIGDTGFAALAARISDATLCIRDQLHFGDNPASSEAHEGLLTTWRRLRKARSAARSQQS